MSIKDRQNKPEAIELMAACRRLYSDTKAVKSVRVWIAAGLAVAGLIATVVNKVPLQNAVALASLIFFVLSPLLSEEESARAEKAAAIQEQFDVEVLGVQPNEILSKRVTPEEVRGAATRYGVDRSELKDWYELSVADQLPAQLQALLCQRCNVVWDSLLRRRYGMAVFVSSLAFLIACLVVGFALGSTLAGFVTALVAILPAIANGFDVFLGHRRIAKRKEELADCAMVLWEAALKNGGQVPAGSMRQLQDEIFHARATTLLVPDFWAKRIRPNSRSEALAAMDRLAAEARMALGPGPTGQTPAPQP